MKRQKTEDVPELIQLIQSRLPVKEVARTSLLSKSWLHAWSTIPILKFDVGRGKSMKLVDMDRTLTRYLRDNIPIEKFDLKIDLENQESASHVENLIRAVASSKTNCLKECSLSINVYGASFTLPDEILSCENLTKIRVSLPTSGIHPVRMITTSIRVINCVSLQELHLQGVCISEEALNDILSSCSSLVKIVLLLTSSCKGFKTIKVKDLPRLYDLQVALYAAHLTDLEIGNVPNLGVFSCDLDLRFQRVPPLPFHAYSISLGSRVKQLTLGGMITDNTCLDMIKSGFPCLESLNLWLTCWKLGSFHFACASIKRLSLKSCPNDLIDIQVHATNLVFFEFDGDTLPSLSFPVSSLKLLRLSLSLHCDFTVDANFFLKMRETLMLSRNCYLQITTDNSEQLLDIDIDDVRKGLVLPPATNVQEVWFETGEDDGLWERSPFFDAFFEICHPRRVFALPDMSFGHNNHFCKLMMKEVLEKKKTETEIVYWPRYLKHVQIRWDPLQKWKTLTNSHTSFLDGSTPDVSLEFKLKWR